jgi:hypothetical protein
MRNSVLALSLCLAAVGCTPAIPIESDFGVSALRADQSIPPEFVAFNRYDPRVNGLLAEQSCATPNEAQYVKALAAVPGEILTQATRCQTYQPWFAPAYGARPAQ